jgi:hypothetical protein
LHLNTKGVACRGLSLDTATLNTSNIYTVTVVVQKI